MVNKKNNNLILNIIGDGKEKEKITNRINELNLNNSIIMHGFKDKKYINEFLSKSSLYLMTSYEESFGIFLL